MLQLPYRRPRLFELHDQVWFPSELRQHTQNLLTFLWTHQILPFQTRAPYVGAAKLLERVINDIELEDDALAGSGEGEQNGTIAVLDCCSGAGGPMPKIERYINSRRRARVLPPVPVLLSDLHPHIPAWSRLTPKSNRNGFAARGAPTALSYVPESVNALETPLKLKRHRHIRTFCLSFHHFGESSARKVLEDAMRTSEGVVIFELQAPDLDSIIAVLALFPLTFFITPFTRPTLLVLLLTYVIPLLPLIFVWDGLVSIWRTRTPEHLTHLATLASMAVSLESGMGHSSEASSSNNGKKGSLSRARSGSVRTRVAGQHGTGEDRPEATNGHEEPSDLDWVWEFGTRRHTWPCGFMHWAVGRKDRSLATESPHAPTKTP